ncbi:MAG: 5'-3' exonuclease H3TH domain-containing protein [Patescibacteria group bacterium]
MEKRLIIIDSNALLHRAFHALPPLTNKKGQPTGAVYGYLLTLFKAIKDLKADYMLYVVATFDTKAKTFRHEDYKEYKAHRVATPDGIVTQIPMAKEILEAFKIPVFAKDGFEADDLIATIAITAAKKDNLEVYILSGDLDNLQLVSDKIKVYTLGKGIKDTIIYDRGKVIERFGVTPEQMNDFKALTGDPSDNIPGVPGIGKKTAAEIIQKYGSIKNLYDELSTDTAVLKPKVKEALKANKESAFLSQHLVETKKDVDIEFILEDCSFGKFNLNEAEKKLIDLEFNSLIERCQALYQK